MDRSKKIDLRKNVLNALGCIKKVFTQKKKCASNTYIDDILSAQYELYEENCAFERLICEKYKEGTELSASKQTLINDCKAIIKENNDKLEELATTFTSMMSNKK
jgi:hypothetical protein